MKAAIYTSYGDPEVLQIQDVPVPVPKPNELLVAVHYSTMNRTDCGLRSARYFISRFFTGIIRPKQQIMGSEFAGEVLQVGAEVTEFQSGDRVFGFDDVHGGMHAESMVIRADGPVMKIPAGFDYRDVAAAGEGATYALNDIDAVGVQAGQAVMVYGASGAIGSAAVQILKHQGAVVTAVCGTAQVQLLESLGADKVVDYQKSDFTKTSDRYDFVFDAVGKSSYRTCRKIMKKHGIYCSTELGTALANPLLALWFRITRSRRVIFPIPKIEKSKIAMIVEMLAAGSYRPVIDREFPLDQIVEAAKYAESGQKIGNVLIKVGRS